ncbi:MAG TPA: hypothetical protein VIV35_09795 [Chitinophagaceae bacterium]
MQEGKMKDEVNDINNPASRKQYPAAGQINARPGLNIHLSYSL